jgi:hypothetical protein
MKDAERRVRRQISKVYAPAVDKLPWQLAYRIDWARPTLRDGWGGPLNGQVERRRIARDLFRSIPFGSIIETGSFRGITTEFFALTTGLPVKTIESSPRYAAYAKLRNRVHHNVEVVVGDSRVGLDQLPKGAKGDIVFYYLDAHWYNDLPLREEITIIKDAGFRAVIMIDDFQVPDDPGYKYDDYGPGMRLTPEILEGLPIEDWGVYYPAARAADETGGRSGSVILVHPEFRSIVDGLDSLRQLG